MTIHVYYPLFVDLKVFTPYHFLISACTMVGCKNSTQVTVLTTELPPVHVDVPVLIILDSRTVEAQLSKICSFSSVALEWYNSLSSYSGHFS